MSYTTVNIQQGSDKWLEWRSQGIGASDAPVIMGENPWTTPTLLLQEKCRVSTKVPNAAMIRGTKLEPEARKSYELSTGIHVAPVCLQSKQFEWLHASVDGLASDGSSIVEIKCGESVYRKSSASGTVPDYYFGQLQHMLAITNLKSIDFYCYLPNRPEVLLHIARDDKYIERLLEAEALFWKTVLNNRSHADNAYKN